ncbi:protoporphyrinogen oxidase [Kocuria palustris]|uniref:protoporphyrinogen oxidase n=1 Tax=Kocuria palustris TaxID=71999 RepID=UPI001642AAA1|nr:protoporphyrinogen oxidase [Kocuria palustris]
MEQSESRSAAEDSAARAPRTALVVGGGIAGLCAARELAAAGLRVTLVEARPQFGGSVGSHLVDGLVLDSGADSFATRSDAVSDLARELGLGDRIVRPSPAGSWVALPDGPRPSQSTGVLGIPGDLSEPGLAQTLGRFGLWRARADLKRPARIGADARTLGELVRKRMGSAVLERMVAPFTLGVHSAQPDALDPDMVAPGLREALRREGSLSRAAASLRRAAPAGSNVAGLRGGMNTLAEALVADLKKRRVKLVLGYDVIAVDRDPRRPGWMVLQRQPEVGDKSAIARGELLVMASDGPTAVRLLGGQSREIAGFQPGLGPRIALATLVVDRPELDRAPRGTGILVAPDVPDVHAKALTHVSAKWDWVREALPPGRHVLRLSYGRVDSSGRNASRELELADDQLLTLAMRDASHLLGVELPHECLVDGDVVRWEQAMARPSAGHAEKVAAFRRALEQVGGVAAVGSWLSGTGLVAVVADTRREVARVLAEHGIAAAQDPAG